MDLHKETFDPLAGTAFQVTQGAGTSASLTLAEVSEGGRDAAFEQFSLIFTGPREPFFPQGTYEFHHSGLGEFPLFIVPIARMENGFRYQAVFNRLRK